jgi:phosphoserine phosphatase
MVDGMPVQWFAPRQRELVTALQETLSAPEHRGLDLEIDATTIATDIQDRRAGKDLGARRVVDWLARRGLMPEHFVTMGDSQSDVAMAVELQDKHRVDFVHVGDRNLTLARLHCRVVGNQRPLRVRYA